MHKVTVGGEPTAIFLMTSHQEMQHRRLLEIQVQLLILPLPAVQLLLRHHLLHQQQIHPLQAAQLLTLSLLLAPPPALRHLATLLPLAHRPLDQLHQDHRTYPLVAEAFSSSSSSSRRALLLRLELPLQHRRRSEVAVLPQRRHLSDRLRHRPLTTLLVVEEALGSSKRALLLRLYLPLQHRRRSEAAGVLRPRRRPLDHLRQPQLTTRLVVEALDSSSSQRTPLLHLDLLLLLAVVPLERNQLLLLRLVDLELRPLLQHLELPLLLLLRQAVCLAVVRQLQHRLPFRLLRRLLLLALLLLILRLLERVRHRRPRSALHSSHLVNRRLPLVHHPVLRTRLEALDLSRSNHANSLLKGNVVLETTVSSLTMCPKEDSERLLHRLPRSALHSSHLVSRRLPLLRQPLLRTRLEHLDLNRSNHADFLLKEHAGMETLASSPMIFPKQCRLVVQRTLLEQIDN